MSIEPSGAPTQPVTDSLSAAFHDDTAAVLELAGKAAAEYVAALSAAPAAPRRQHEDDGREVLARFAGPLPERGMGAEAAVRQLTEHALPQAVRSSGPRYFHFVTGGTTPAALAADWLTSTIDQNAAAWVCSPMATHLETVALGWLKELFGLPAGWGAVTTTGGTMANFTGLAAARRYWAARHGVDVDVDGLARLPPMPVFGSGFAHASISKSLGMLGLGRSALRRLTVDGSGRLDLGALRVALEELRGAPAVLVATAGEPDAGRFDPVAQLADLADEFDAWLHVDGAFGMFAALNDRTACLVEGAARAHSVTADGHKWLNVPFDTGFCFVRHPEILGPVFTNQAAYLVDANDPHVNYANLGPDNSRRARGLAVWATLAAYGREGYRELISRHLAVATRFAEEVQRDPDLELLAPATLNAVCFRVRPAGVAVDGLDALNRRLADRLLLDGRVHLGATTFDGRAALRPVFVNWRTTSEDTDLILKVLRELVAEDAACHG
ncbi:pyridoxal phosphate-dependent decarboxylase family protein [Streptomyces lonarensis]|uniref:Aspartate aminotransferase family protein n=1 Tax=Streptomyces lonarensis TaxID=700599 RepID=A0A7X6CYB6_9ACTN|nr:pyridoxal-dependent decarboxylase [Streptomyces lonarensis]NJQ04658.1 aspartate aminotransferase family protein [Streptomyces lonarensis]